MKTHFSIKRWLLFFEVTLALFVPVMVLLMATISALSEGVGALAGNPVESLIPAVMVTGGYLGIVGIINQFVFLNQKNTRPLGWTTFLFTLIGCFAAVPYAFLILGPGNLLNIVMGFAPILVAIQLTFMNRSQFQALFKKGL